MGLKDLFGKKKKKLDPLKDLTLASMKVGYYVEYDSSTWEVTAYNEYDWGSGDITYEWQLENFENTAYLEREVDDEDYWSLSKKISINRFGSEIKEHILNHDDPPEEITFEGTTYYLEESGGGHLKKGGKEPGKELLRWDYEDDLGKRFLSIDQWGESDFEASTGFQVEEYQFMNILPNK